MTDDDVTQLRSEVPLPDEATAQRVYERATRGPRRLSHRWWLVLGVAGAAICAATVAVIATGTFTGDSRHAIPPTDRHGPAPVPATGEQGPAGLVHSFTRDRGVLRSVTVKLSVETPNARVDLQVWHNTDTSFAELNHDLAAGNGTPASRELVFQTEVSLTDAPPAAIAGPTGDTSPEPGWSFWAGALYPSDWKGGCQRGFYEISARGAVYVDGEWFRCRKD